MSTSISSTEAMGYSVTLVMKARMNTTARIGTLIGSRIWKNACQVVAPSTMAASSSEASMLSK